VSFYAVAALPIFAPAPKVGALGEIGIPYILYIRTVLVHEPGRSLCILYTRWFFIALIAMDGMYAGFAGAKACHKKNPNYWEHLLIKNLRAFSL